MSAAEQRRSPEAVERALKLQEGSVLAREVLALREEVASLRERNTQLGLLRVDAESAVECVRALCQGASSVVPVSAVLAVLGGES